MQRILIITLLVLLSGGGEAQSWTATAGDDYEVTSNITYRTALGWEGKLDVYVPAVARAGAPTLVWFHGGGWTQGSKESEFLYVLPYLERGWSVVNVEYRRASTAPAPAAVEDCRCALQWIAANAAKYRLNVDKLVVSGVSAGGHLALMAAFLPDTSRFSTSCETRAAVRVAAVVNWFGPADVAELLDGPHRFAQAVEWFAGAGDRASVAAEVSPLSYVRANVPPVITIHGTHDEIIPYDQSVELHQALRAARVPNRLVTIPNAGHGFFGTKTADAYRQIWRFLARQGISTKR